MDGTTISFEGSREVVDYLLLRKRAADFSQAASKLVGGEGWQPYGQPFLCEVNFLYQAFVKYAEVEPPKVMTETGDEVTE